MIISLCGFMGAGKSTAGKYLARVLDYEFIDLDCYIEQKLDTTVSELFKAKGEEYFRMQELAFLREIIEKYLCEDSNNLILSLGGGTVTVQDCAKLIKENTKCIYIRCSKEELVKRLKRNSEKRPVLCGKTDMDLEEHISNLIQQRESAYRYCAHKTIDTTDNNLQETVNALLQLL